MSDLRKYLQSARAEYRQETYPGDLALEVLAKPRFRGNGTILSAVALAAVAAVLAVALLPVESIQNTSPPSPSLEMLFGGSKISSPVSLPTVAAIPDEVGLVPTIENYSFSTVSGNFDIPSVSFPSFDQAMSETASSTTQEAI